MSSAISRQFTCLSRSSATKQVSKLQQSFSKLYFSSGKDEDPFGVNFKDSSTESGNIGPKDSLPPKYVRDAATGKFTGEVQAEATAEEKRMVNLGPITKESILTQRISESLDQSDMEDVARRIREDKLSLNPLGRQVNISSPDEEDFDISTPLTPEELKSLHKFMKITTPANEKDVTKHLIQESKDYIPVNRQSSHKAPASGKDSTSPDNFNPDLDLDWMSASAQRTMSAPDVDDEDLEDPFSNLMPSDLNPSKKVNRKQAKPIPKQLLHHNNLSLLRRYVTPGGQIMTRIQSRLGAKDQRKIAKLVKRARHLGLIPVIGQWKFEDHGNVKADDLFEDKDWEKKLIERGLVERKSSYWQKMKKNADGSDNVTNGW